MRDLYEILGVGPGATEKEITSAWRKQASLHHPDRNPGDNGAAERFRAAADAHSVLSDPAKRLAYDTERLRPRPPDPREFFTDHFGPPFGHQGVRDFGRHRRPTPGADVEREVVLTVEESVLGATKTVMSEHEERVLCARCSGARSEPGTVKVPCTQCAGSGRSFFHTGQFPMRGTCKHCKGNGDIPMIPCSGCGGSGRTRTAHEYSVKVPPGVADGQRMRLAGKGEPGVGGPPGDMYVTVRVAEGGRFSRRGNDLYTTVRVPFHVAVGHLGTSRWSCGVVGVDMREHHLDLSAGFKPGETEFVVRGAGVGGLSGERGNLHVKVLVDLPEARSPRAAALLRELVDELGGSSPAPRGAWHYPSPDG